MWEKVDIVLLRNFKDHWRDPLITKYLGSNASTHYEGYVLLREQGKPIFISHPFNYAQAKKVFSKKAIVKTYWKKEDLGKIFKKYCKKRVGFNATYLNFASTKALKRLLKGKKFIDVSAELEKERELKTVDEIKCIQKAVRETHNAVTQVKNKLRVGVTEKAIVQEFKQFFEKKGLEMTFCIVAFGNNTSHIHYEPNETKLKSGEPVLIDVGASYEGYCSDISDTFWFGARKGKTYERFTAALLKVQNAQTDIEHILKEGTVAKKLYSAATKYVGKLPHAIGHGIGIEVHDMPAGIGEKSTWKLKTNMVLAIEPAIYTKKFGVRLEKNYLITQKGFVEL